MTLQVRAQVSLKPFNSFGIDVRARLFAEAHSDADVREALACAAAQALPLLVIGGGSNLLLTQDISALVLRMATQGIRVLHDDGVHVVVEAEAGEAWHPFVLWTLAQGFCGLENLSLIPGTVGAAPMQNIGAYGVEIKDVFAGLTALDRQTGELREFTLQECNFAYRDSLFKHETGRWLILRVRFALSRASHLKLDYDRCNNAWPGRGLPRRRRAMSAARFAASAAKNCRTRPCWAMPAASSRTRWYPRPWPKSCGRGTRIWWPTLRLTGK